MLSMDHLAVGRCWDENAEVWTRLVREGYDVYRDHLNTPAFLAMLPPVRGLAGLDIGCGEGSNTRQLARRGARMAAVDISQTFVSHANAEEARGRWALLRPRQAPSSCLSPTTRSISRPRS